MGMSSSQARLLSITARLTDNEYHSQRLTNEKMKLSNITDEARIAYNKSLDSTKLMFTTFNDTGMSGAVQLTPNILYGYQPTKNQYALSNASGKILVPTTEATNYKNSETLFDFLKCYDDTIATKEYKDMGKNPAYDEYLLKLEEWYREKPSIDDPKFYNKPGKNNELFQNFATASATCFSNAVNASTYSGCYLHVLAHMLDLTLDENNNPTGYPKNFTTSTNDKISIPATEITGSAINSDGQTPNMVGVSNAISYGYDFDNNGTLDTVYAYDRQNSDTLIETLSSKGYTQEEINTVIKQLSGENMTTGGNVDKLLSSYYLDETGNLQLKSLKQKCIDLYYAVENKVADYNSVLKPIIYSFQDDLVHTFPTFNSEAYNMALKEWEDKKPEEVPMFKEVTKNRIVVLDKEKSQWYTNLWYRMNGSKNPQVITSQLMEEVYDTTSLYNTLEDESKNPENKDTNKYFSILDNSLSTSSKWISDAVSQGIVTMESIQYNSSDKDNKITWNSIIYTNAIDISSEDDSSGIASAEAKYQMVLDEVNVKDKRYQSMLKKLDTEHNALQTEYESVKNAMQKNIDRSYKAFNG